MTIETLSNLFTFVGGLGMFLYGMNIMADGMQKTTGDKMRQLLGILTNNRIMAVIVGALITAIVQSSGATTVMVVGFVNAGIMSLGQAVGVIMGANIGTCITSWIVSLGQVGETFKAISPDFYAPLLIGIGAFLIMFCKKQGKKLAGEILVGVGLLFIGLAFMKDAASAYSDLPIFVNAFKLFGSNPIIGMSIGVLITALMQSSSASVGILQTIASTGGVVTTASAVYISLGSNIGSCFTALLSSIGAPKTAKRAAVIHLLFNIIGAVVFGTALFLVFTLNPILGTSAIDSVGISIFHTVFNITCTALLLPFSNLLVKASGKIVKSDETETVADTAELTLNHLDERILETPSFAVESAVKEVIYVGEVAFDNLKLSIHAMLNNDKDEANKVKEVEEKIDKMVSMISDYLVKISNLSINEKQHQVVNNMFYTISNIERVGDHAENIAELADEKADNNIVFSESAKMEMEEMCDTALKAYENALLARKDRSIEHVRKVVKYEDKADMLEDELREQHIHRLSSNKCNSEAGVIFIDALTNLERVSDHSLNIANYVKDEL
ncbi:MAG: Na/Pi cotransporter family protein [bacterium]|nr:Na/Pi cotransporter family protein [bacterium]